MALNAGTKVGPYEIIALIGAGGMGEVYRARDLRLGRDVAVKVLPASFAADPDRLRRFEQEARAVAALNTCATSPPKDNSWWGRASLAAASSFPAIAASRCATSPGSTSA